MNRQEHILVETEQGDVEVNEALLTDFERVARRFCALGVQAKIEDVAVAYAEVRHLLGSNMNLESADFMADWDARIEEIARRRASEC